MHDEFASWVVSLTIFQVVHEEELTLYLGINELPLGLVYLSLDFIDNNIDF